jgi:alanine dehydrogenase
MKIVLEPERIRAQLSLDDCFRVVEEAFRQLGERRAAAPGVLGVPALGGGFHIKAGVMELGRKYFAAKINGNFSTNAALGLPRIQGVIYLADATNGAPLAIFDSMEITRLRTAAATAVAASYLALPRADIATIAGCGDQAPAQLRALARVRPLRRVFAYDLEPERARSFADSMAAELGVEITATADLRSASRESAMIITCTPARAPILFRDFVSPGVFIAAVGADAEDKNEIDAELMRDATVVTDIHEQCARIGDLHHAIRRGVLGLEDVHAELGEIVAGTRRGRASEEEIIVFDSTGMALQDVAAAAVVYEAVRGQELN